MAHNDLLQRYTEYTFFNFEKNEFHKMLKTVKDTMKDLGNVEDYTKYNAMYLSKDNPSEEAMLEHLEIAKTWSEPCLSLGFPMVFSSSCKNSVKLFATGSRNLLL